MYSYDYICAIADSDCIFDWAHNKLCTNLSLGNYQFRFVSIGDSIVLEDLWRINFPTDLSFSPKGMFKVETPIFPSIFQIILVLYRVLLMLFVFKVQ